MIEAEEIVEDVVAFFQPKHLAGKCVLMTAGPTFEAIDPVRGITNLSSGKMGFAIARAAAEAGAQVTDIGMCGTEEIYFAAAIFLVNTPNGVVNSYHKTPLTPARLNISSFLPAG